MRRGRGFRFWWLTELAPEVKRYRLLAWEQQKSENQETEKISN